MTIMVFGMTMRLQARSIRFHLLNFFYWLKKTGYGGYISTDQYPYREDGRDAVNETVRWMDILPGL